MVKIRLSRIGKNNRPFWRIVAVDARAKRDGAFIDHLGTYDPIKHKMITLDAGRIAEWVQKGAQCSDAVTKLVKNYSTAS